MNLKEYQVQAKRTCASLGNDKLDLCHMTLGINSEIVELQEALDKNDTVNVGEECIDVMFYVSNIYTFLGKELETLTHKYDIPLSDKGIINHMYAESANFQDDVKKHIAYGRELALDKLPWITNAVFNIIDRKGLKLEQLLDNNIAKLRHRFPDKFSEEKANNRDLETERKILEQ